MAVVLAQNVGPGATLAARPPAVQAKANTLVKSGVNVAPGTALGAPGLAHPPVAVVPAAHPAAAAAPAPVPTPLDSTYWANVNTNLFNTNNQISNTQLAEKLANINYQNQLAQLQYQEPRSLLQLENTANQRGSLYSSVYGQQRGDTQHSYQVRNQSVANAQNALALTDAAKIAELEGGIPLYNNNQYLAAVLRASQRDQNNPAVGALANAIASKTAPTTKAKVPAVKGKNANRFNVKVPTVKAKNKNRLNAKAGRQR